MSNRNSLTLFITAALLLIFAMPISVCAAWSNDPAVNTSVSTGAGYDEDQRNTNDGSGGTIIVWVNYRTNDPALSTSYGDLYVQRLDANGNVMWTVGGVAITTVTKALNPRIVADGSGGAIVTWEHWNGSNFDIYAQKINASGTVLWTAGGVTVSAASHTQRYPLIKTDGAGGAIIVWQDNRNGSTITNYDIYAQRVDATDGHGLWTADGVPVCTASGDQKYPRMTTDDAGGAIIVWQDYRSGATADIYVQKINSSGVAQWTADGVPVVTALYDQYWQWIVKDGSGGAIIVWEDYRSNTGWEVYAQRVDSGGTVKWTAGGVAVCSTSCSTGGAAIRKYPLPASDNNGGIVITWQDYRLGTYYHIYAQRLDSNGNALWAADGEAISSLTQTHGQWYPNVVSDSYGRSIITWFDTNGLYAQRLDLSGNKLWTADGVVVSTGTTSSTTPYWPAIISDTLWYGAIIAWTDYRNGITNTDIYAQMVQPNGTLPCPNYPVTISGTASYFPTIQAAYDDAAAGGHTVQIQSLEFAGDLNLLSNKIVKLKGGYSGCDYSSNAYYSTIHGKVTISGGTVTAERLIIM
jgi:hypothetical protein